MRDRRQVVSIVNARLYVINMLLFVVNLRGTFIRQQTIEFKINTFFCNCYLIVDDKIVLPQKMASIKRRDYCKIKQTDTYLIFSVCIEFCQEIHYSAGS
jgi:hypothetical protein